MGHLSTIQLNAQLTINSKNIYNEFEILSCKMIMFLQILALNWFEIAWTWTASYVVHGQTDKWFNNNRQLKVVLWENKTLRWWLLVIVCMMMLCSHTVMLVMLLWWLVRSSAPLVATAAATVNEPYWLLTDWLRWHQTLPATIC